MSIPVVLVDDDQAVLPFSIDYTDFVARAFGEAYLRVVNDGGGDPANNKYNLDPKINWPVPTEDDPSTKSDSDNLDELLDIPGGLESHANRSNDYWIAHVLWGFQGGTVEDMDPFHEKDVYLGVVPRLGGRGTFMPLEQIFTDFCLEKKKNTLYYL